MEVMDEEVGVKVVEVVELAIKWAGKEVAVLLPADRQTVADLRRELYLLTRVPPERQKLLGLKPSPGKSLDDTRVADLGLKKGAKVMMMGTPEEAQLVEPEEQFDVLDDFVYDPRTIGVRDREENIQKLQQRVKNVRRSHLHR
jgi:ubiquitin-like domain-containing CTD phosphatase 1